MPGKFKECAGHYRGFVLFAQQFEKCFRIPAREPWEKHGACRWAEAFQITARIEKGIDNGTVGGKKRARPLAKFFKMIERNQGHPFGGVRRDSSKKIIEKP